MGPGEVILLALKPKPYVPEPEVTEPAYRFIDVEAPEGEGVAEEEGEVEGGEDGEVELDGAGEGGGEGEVEGRAISYAVTASIIMASTAAAMYHQKLLFLVDEVVVILSNL